MIVPNATQQFFDHMTNSWASFKGLTYFRVQSVPWFKPLNQGAGLAGSLQWPKAPLAGPGPGQPLEVFLTGMARMCASLKSGPGRWPWPCDTMQQQRGPPNLKSFWTGRPARASASVRPILPWPAGPVALSGGSCPILCKSSWGLPTWSLHPDICRYLYPDIDIYKSISRHKYPKGVPLWYLLRDIYTNFTDMYTNRSVSIFKLKNGAVGFVWILGVFI